MRILLINPPYIGWLNDIKVEPIGLLYIASFLRGFGHEIELYDAYIGEPEEDFIDKILHWKPQIVGCAVYTVSEEFCFRMARLTKQLDPSITFVAGGPHATFTPKRMLTRCEAIDIITHKESEETMAAIAMYVEQGRNFNYVPGISYRIASATKRIFRTISDSGPYVLSNHESNVEIITNQFQHYKASIDALPYPDKGLLSNKYYNKYHATGVISGRGCVYKCDFCVSPAFFRGVRQRSVELVAEELRQIMSQREVRHVRFYDDIFPYNLTKLRKVKEFIGPLGLTYDCYIRIDVTTNEMLDLMKESGCIQVRFGVESGIEKMRSLRKGGRTVSFKKHIEIVDKCRELGIETLASYIFGFPDESRDDMMATIEFADQLNTDRVGFYKLTPYPGTIYWNMLLEQYKEEDIPLDDYCKFDNHVSLNKYMTSEEIFQMLRLGYEMYYEHRNIPYDNPDTLRFLTSLPKLRY
jgi:anaerobic magnesium-protoporphyrin IX monomethyl ester cyclase